MNDRVVDELVEFCKMTNEEVMSRVSEGLEGTAKSYREMTTTPEEWERETDSFLFELANWEPDPFRVGLARIFKNGLKGQDYKVLDYGCGIGSFILNLVDVGIRVVACDINVLNKAFVRFRIKKRNLEDMAEIFSPEEILNSKEQYIIISCQHVLEHVKDPWSLMRFFRNILSPHGCFVGVAPFDQIGPEFPQHLPENAHLSLEKLCNDTGFKVTESLVIGGTEECPVKNIVAIKE